VTVTVRVAGQAVGTETLDSNGTVNVSAQAPNGSFAWSVRAVDNNSTAAVSNFSAYGVQQGGLFAVSGGKLGPALTALAGGLGGETPFGVFVFGIVWLSLYVGGNRSLATPTVVTVLLGTIAIPLVPAQIQQVAYTVVVLGFVAGLFVGLNRYVLNPSSA
jgi:hypothetical protein